MSDKNFSRRTAVEITFDGVDITKSIQQYLISLSYTDTDSEDEEEADDLQIRLQDSDGIWLEKWLNDAVETAASERIKNDLYIVTANNGLNVRSGPGEEYKKLGAFSKWTEITVSEIENGWAKINYQGTTAYVSAVYIKPSDTVSGNRPAATGLEIQAVIARQNWRGDGADDILDCGIFELDSVECAGPPAEITLKATALPFRSDIRQMKKSQGWESYYLDGIAYEIAARNNMICLFLSNENSFYERVEQYQTSDIAFLHQLCQDAGCSLKTTNKMLVIFDRSEYENKPAVRTITRGDGSYDSYVLRTSTADTQYQSCRVFYNDPVSGKCIAGTAYCEDYDSSKKDNKKLEINRKVNSIAEAETLAKKYLKLHNQFEKSVRFVCPGDPYMLAGCNLELRKWGAWDGKYHIIKVKHDVNSSGGYTTTVEARRVTENA